MFTKWQPTPGITPETSLEQLELLRPWLSYIDVFARDERLTRLALREFSELWTLVFRHARPSPAWPAPVCALLEFVKDDAAESLRADSQFLTHLMGGP